MEVRTTGQNAVQINPSELPPNLNQPVTMVREQQVFLTTENVKSEQDDSVSETNEKQGDDDGETKQGSKSFSKKAPPPPKLGPMKIKEKRLRYSPYEVKKKMNPNALPFIARLDEPYEYTPPVANTSDDKTEVIKKGDSGLGQNKQGPSVNMSAFEAVFGKPIFPVHFVPIGISSHVVPSKPHTVQTSQTDLYNPIATIQTGLYNPMATENQKSTKKSETKTKEFDTTSELLLGRPTSPSLLDESNQRKSGPSSEPAGTCILAPTSECPTLLMNEGTLGQHRTTNNEKRASSPSLLTQYEVQETTSLNFSQEKPESESVELKKEPQV